MFKSFVIENKKIILWITGAAVSLAVALVIVFVSINIARSGNDKQKFDINNVEIRLDDEAVTNLTKPFGSDDFTLSVVVNNGSIDSKYASPAIEWSFVGNSLGCAIEDGVFSLADCDTLGVVMVRVKVKSNNEMTADANIFIVAKPDSVLRNIELENSAQQKSYIEGQPLDKSDFVVVADFGDYKVKVTDYVADKSVFTLADGELQISYANGGVEKTMIIPVSVAQKTLQSIEITKAPLKTSYIEGQKFDKTGLEVSACYEYLTEIITDYFLDDDKILSTEDFSVTIFYIENHTAKGHITKTAIQSITVANRILQSISVDASKAKLNYVQGQKFDKSGLKVTAVYDFGEQAVEDYTVDTDTKLAHGVTEWSVSYTENGVTKTSVLEINIDAPYENLREIRFGDYPNEASLSWVYYYTTDDGEDKIDDTAFAEHGLAFNEPAGAYVVPVGATVTVVAVNPAIIDFYFDGEIQGLSYPARTIDFTLEDGAQAMNITFKKISERMTVTFLSDVNRVIFSYPKPWNGLLRDSDLEQTAFIFGEDDPYNHNVYIIGSEEYGFAELSAFVFTADAEVIVEKRERTKGTNITLVCWDGVEIIVTVDTTAPDWRLTLPELERVGYDFLGWDEQNEKMVAQWSLFDAEYAGQFVGEWYYQVVADATVECYITLNSNGTYEYATYIDGELNLYLYGIYRYDGEQNEITMLSVETDAALLLVSSDDFDFNLSNLLEVNLLIADGYDLYQYDARFDKL